MPKETTIEWCSECELEVEIPIDYTKRIPCPTDGCTCEHVPCSDCMDKYIGVYNCGACIFPREAGVNVWDVKKALDIMYEDKAAHPKSLNWAINRIIQARLAILAGDTEELNVRCLYIINDISHWRHPEAKWVRDTIRAYSKSF